MKRYLLAASGMVTSLALTLAACTVTPTGLPGGAPKPRDNGGPAAYDAAGEPKEVPIAEGLRLELDRNARRSDPKISAKAENLAPTTDLLPSAQVNPPPANRNDLRILGEKSVLHVAISTLGLTRKFYLAQKSVRVRGRLPRPEKKQEMSAVLLPQGLEALKGGPVAIPLLETDEGLFRAEQACVSNAEGTCVRAAGTGVAVDGALEAAAKDVDLFPKLILKSDANLGPGESVRVDFLGVRSDTDTSSGSDFRKMEELVSSSQNSIYDVHKLHPGDNVYVKEIADRAFRHYVTKWGTEADANMADFASRWPLLDCKFVAMANWAKAFTFVGADAAFVPKVSLLVFSGNMPSKGAKQIDMLTRNHAWNGAYHSGELASLISYDYTPGDSPKLGAVFNGDTLRALSARILAAVNRADFGKDLFPKFTGARTPRWYQSYDVPKQALAAFRRDRLGAEFKAVVGQDGFYHQDAKQFYVELSAERTLWNLGRDGGALIDPSYSSSSERYWSLPIGSVSDTTELFGMNFKPDQLSEDHESKVIQIEQTRAGYFSETFAKGDFDARPYLKDYFAAFPSTSNADLFEYFQSYPPSIGWGGYISMPHLHAKGGGGYVRYVESPSVLALARFWKSKNIRIEPLFRMNVQFLIQGR